MSSILKFQSFYGNNSEAPHCYLLQIDEFRILLDCGWDETFSSSFTTQIKRHLPTIDAVLISHASFKHLGALPYLVGKLGFKAPVFCTPPVFKMGQMFMYDTFQSYNNYEDFNLFSLDDIDAAFENFKTLKYSQSHMFTGKGTGIKITAFPAGHMIGGAVWKIVKENEEQFVYAVDYNNKKERHLNPCSMLSAEMIRPYMLISDAYEIDVQLRRRTRDEKLLSEIIKTLNGGGNVLMPIDSAGRLLEMSNLLDQMWPVITSGARTKCSLVVLSNVAYNVIEFAKSHVEWMSNRVLRQFEDNRQNPFNLKNVHLIHSMNDLENLKTLKVVLATLPDLQSGYARELFVKWAPNPKNTIIFISKSGKGSLAREIIDNDGTTKVYNLDIKTKTEKSVGIDDDVDMRVEQEDVKFDIKVEETKKEDVEEEKLDVEVVVKSDNESIDSDIETDDIMMNVLPIHKSLVLFPEESRIKSQTDDYGDFFDIKEFNLGEKHVPIVKAKQPLKVIKREEETIETQTILNDCICESVQVEQRAKVIYINFEGRSDGESIKKILNHMKPEMLILVRCTKPVFQDLADYVKSTYTIDDSKIYHLNSNAVFSAQTDKCMYQVKISETLFNNTTFQVSQDCEISWVDGLIDTKTLSIEQDVDKVDDEIPILIPYKKPALDHDPVYINPPKLSNLKQLINSQGIPTEFNGGTLICNGNIALKRRERGLIEMEGVLCKEYFLIRDILYQQYTII